MKILIYNIIWDTSEKFSSVDNMWLDPMADISIHKQIKKYLLKKHGIEPLYFKFKEKHEL